MLVLLNFQVLLLVNLHEMRLFINTCYFKSMYVINVIIFVLVEAAF
jgi:hypothetical protein